MNYHGVGLPGEAAGRAEIVRIGAVLGAMAFYFAMAVRR